MKRFAKLIGLLAGVGAIVRLMRDRLVTLTVAREPQPPTFRVPEPVPSPPANLTRIKGIGPAYGERLAAAGIATSEVLASSEPSRVAEVAGVSEARAREWIAQAKA